MVRIIKSPLDWFKRRVLVPLKLLNSPRGELPRGSGWPDSPVLAKGRYVKIGNRWLREGVPGCPTEKVMVFENDAGGFAGVYLESYPGKLSLFLATLISDRGLLPPIAEPSSWPRLMPDAIGVKAVCARAAGWIFYLFIKPDGRAVFRSRPADPDPEESFPPRVVSVQHCLKTRRDDA